MNKIQKGERAERILKDPVFEDAMNAVKMKVFDELRKSGLNEKGKREDLYKLMRAADLFENELKSLISDMIIEKNKAKQPEIKRIL